MQARKGGVKMEKNETLDEQKLSIFDRWDRDGISISISEKTFSSSEKSFPKYRKSNYKRSHSHRSKIQYNNSEKKWILNTA